MTREEAIRIIRKMLACTDLSVRANLNADMVDACEDAMATMRKYQLMQADYEAKLKADLEAILVDLQLDIEGQKFDVHIDKDVWNDAIRVCSDIIQQKIDNLKGQENEQS